MATAGNGISLTTTPTVLFNATSGGDDGGCTTYMVKNRSGSAGNVLVNVLGLHAPGEFVGIAPGDPPLYFRLGSNSILQVTAKSDATATIDCGIVARI
jgi:hypothetical protein